MPIEDGEGYVVSLSEPKINKDQPTDVDVKNEHRSGYTALKLSSSLYAGKKVPNKSEDYHVSEPEDFGIDWCSRFIHINNELETINAKMEEKDHTNELYEVYTNMANVANDFLHLAQTYGKIIISEVALPNSKKTIKPWLAGGLAGGEKYKVQNIMFKFAVDWQGYYGGDEFVMKAAGHELKGLMAVYQCQIAKLNAPLMCLIDHKGYRLIALSMLPISKETIVYGSPDGGVTVYATDPEVCEMMKVVGAKLNLKEHWAGIKDVQKRIVGPTDIEVHNANGRYFIVDFARLFPPETTDSASGTFLYRMLRPELVKRSPVPLSSDANSRFGSITSEEHNREVENATNMLLNEIIPTFAYTISRKPVEFSKLIPDLHRQGINCRHLGLVRYYAHNSGVRQQLLTECIARVMKNTIRKRMRNLLRKKVFALEEYFTMVLAHILPLSKKRQDLLEFLNMVLGNTELSDQFWKVDIKELIGSYFTNCLTTEEMSPDYHLRKCVSSYALIFRAQQLTGFELDYQAYREIAKDSNTFELVKADIKQLPEKTKHINIVDYAEATSLFIQSTLTNRGENHRLFDLAMQRFEQAINVKPDDVICMRKWADALFFRYNQTKDDTFFYQAIEKYQLAGSSDRLTELAQNTHKLIEKSGSFADAEPLLAKASRLCTAAIATGVNYYKGCMLMGDTYYMVARRFHQLKYLPLAGFEYRKAILLQPSAFCKQMLQLLSHVEDSVLAEAVQLTTRYNESTMELHQFDWRWCFKITPSMMAVVLKHLNTVRTVSFLNLVSLVDEDLCTILEHCSFLEDLNLKNCHLLTDKSMSLLPHCSLTSLDLRGCYEISNQAGFAISLCKNMKSLKLPCKRFSDEGILPILQNCTLTTLCLIHCFQLTRETVFRLGEHSSLRTLYLKWFPDLDDEVLKALHPLLLEEIGLQFIGVSDEALLDLLGKCTQIHTVNVNGTSLLRFSRRLEYIIGRDLKVNSKPTKYKAFDKKQGLSFENNVLSGSKVPCTWKNVISTITTLASVACTALELTEVDFLDNFSVLMTGLLKARGLRAINLNYSFIGIAGAMSLANVLKQNNRISVEKLQLNSTGIGVQGLQAILREFRGSYLEIKSNELDSEAGMIMKDFLEVQRGVVSSLLLANNPLGDEGIKPIVETLSRVPIDRSNLVASNLILDISHCRITVAGTKYVSQMLEVNSDLGSLILSGNDLGDQGITHLTSGLKENRQLTELYLDDTGITDVGLSSLSSALNNNVKCLSLNFNRIQGTGVIDLADALLSPANSVEQLSIMSNPLGDKAVKSFSIALKMSKMKKLNLSFPEAEEKGGMLSHELESQLVDLMCESFDTNCVLNMGTLTYPITTRAKAQYPTYREQLKREEIKNKKKNDPVSAWGLQMKSGKLARYLHQQAAEDHL